MILSPSSEVNATGPLFLFLLCHGLYTPFESIGTNPAGDVAYGLGGFAKALRIIRLKQHFANLVHIPGSPRQHQVPLLQVFRKVADHLPEPGNINRTATPFGYCLNQVGTRTRRYPAHGRRICRLLSLCPPRQSIGRTRPAAVWSGYRYEAETRTRSFVGKISRRLQGSLNLGRGDGHSRPLP